MDDLDANASDTDLVRACLERGGFDQRPYRWLFRRHYPAVFRLCLLRLGDSDEAQDVAQLAFQRAFLRLGTWEQRAAFRTWLHHIATNACLNHVRDRSRRPETLWIDAEREALVPDDTENEPEADILNRDALDRLRGAMARLDAEPRRLLYMKDVEELPYDVIAAQLGIGLSAARMRVMRARRSLADVYRQLEQGGADERPASRFD